MFYATRQPRVLFRETRNSKRRSSLLCFLGYFDVSVSLVAGVGGTPSFHQLGPDEDAKNRLRAGSEYDCGPAKFARLDGQRIRAICASARYSTFFPACSSSLRTLSERRDEIMNVNEDKRMLFLTIQLLLLLLQSAEIFPLLLSVVVVLRDRHLRFCSLTCPYCFRKYFVYFCNLKNNTGNL